MKAERVLHPLYILNQLSENLLVCSTVEESSLIANYEFHTNDAGQFI